MIKKFFSCLAWSGLLAVIGFAAILASPFYFIYSLFSEPWTIEEIEAFKKKIENMANPDGDKEWFNNHKDMYDD